MHPKCNIVILTFSATFYIIFTMEEISNQEGNVSINLFQDEKLTELKPDKEIQEEKPAKKEQKKKSSKKDKKEEKKEPYRNMAARKIVLLIGFILSSAGFAMMVFSAVSLFVPNDFANISIFIPVDIVACALSFAGMVLSVAGANTKKGIAKLSFLFAILGFIISAGMLVVMLASQLLPLQAIERFLKG